jgi:hypothetical protein
VRDRHLIELPPDIELSQHEIIVGLYNPENGDRLPVYDAAGSAIGDSWRLERTPAAHLEN